MDLMYKKINFFTFPLNVAIVDDDIDYLSFLSKELNNTRFKFYNSAIEALKDIKPINIDIKSFLENYFQGIYDLNYKNIEEFIKNYSNKQGIIVSDYDMQYISGIEFLSKYNNSDLIKILLTNVYTPNKAVEALNNKLINYYLPKDRVNTLINVIDEHQRILFENITKNILKFTDINNLKFLIDNEYINIFNSICHKYNIHTYYILNSHGCYYMENETNKFIFSIYNSNDLIELTRDNLKNKIDGIKHANLIPSYFSATSNEFELIKAEKFGNYSYCIENVV